MHVTALHVYHGPVLVYKLYKVTLGCVLGDCVHCNTLKQYTTLVLKGLIGYSDYSFETVIFESFETNRIFVSF